MYTLEEIKHAVERLKLDGKYDIQWWLEELIDRRYRSTEVQEPRAEYAVVVFGLSPG